MKKYLFFDLDPLKLTVADYLLIQEFKKKGSEFSKQLTELSARTILKLVEIDPDFKKFCQEEQFNSHWTMLWQAHAPKLREGCQAFDDYPCQSPFLRFCGVHFFYISAEIAKHLKKDFTEHEIKYLKRALQCSSIHALRRYTTYLYNHYESKSDENYLTQLKYIKKKCEKLVDNYGSFAYLMLAEIYIRLCRLAISKEDIAAAHPFYLSALTCCDYADSILQQSKASISNASLGQGLEMSNSLHIASPAKAKEYIEGNFKDLFESYILSCSKICQF